MKKGKITMTITIGIMCFVLVYTMFIQFRTIGETDITSIENMREEELRTELASWKKKYEETAEKLQETQTKVDEYKEIEANNKEASELLDSELSQTNLNLGKTDVQGDGVIITLKDGTSEVKAIDVLKLINELKFAGAEAISVNDERIINMSEVADVSSYILINQQRLTSPFVIKAIGNQKYLESGLTAKGGYVDETTENGKSVVVEGQKNIKIAKYNREMSLKYINIE